MSGWGEAPGGALLARLIGEAFARAADAGTHAPSVPTPEQTGENGNG